MAKWIPLNSSSKLQFRFYLVIVSIAVGANPLNAFESVSDAQPHVGALTPFLPEYENFPTGLSFPGTEWSHFSGKKSAELLGTWQIRQDSVTLEPYLFCSGEPYGFLKTNHVFNDFELNLEWRFPKDSNGNSGILLFVQEDLRLWPDCLQVQLWQPELGRTFQMGGAKNSQELKGIPTLARALNQWNECQIRSVSGRVEVKINGKLVGEIEHQFSASGAIGLQSEGSEIHFRKLKIKPILAASGEALPVKKDNQTQILKMKSVRDREAGANLSENSLELISQRRLSKLSPQVPHNAMPGEIDPRLGQDSILYPQRDHLH